jgi:hypothetical protein
MIRGPLREDYDAVGYWAALIAWAAPIAREQLARGVHESFVYHYVYSRGIEAGCITSADCAQTLTRSVLDLLADT